MIDVMAKRENRMSSVAVKADADIVARMHAGDSEAFAIVVQCYTPRLLAVAARFFRCAEDRADAVQDAFLSAFRSLSTFAGKARLSTWLHRIVVNVCLMKLRARSRSPEIPMNDKLPPSGGGWSSREPLAVMELSAAEIREQVRSCINRLPPSYRTVLVLRDLEEMDTDVTARALGTTSAVVKTRLHRARRALRMLLEPLLTDQN
jgi:RNA polymerase sigma-70 factor (ECF subfamily)